MTRAAATPPPAEREAARRVNWREIADALAERLRYQAWCPEHEQVADADPDNCPFCADRTAFLAYRKAGGKVPPAW